MIAGACLCGAVRYEAAEHLPTLTHCHCATCRKHHGAPFASWLEVAPRAFRWLAGESSVVSYASGTTRERRSCANCSSVAPTPLGDRLLLPAGNVASDLGDLDARHVFVGSKAPWHPIADELPKHDAGAPGWTHELQDTRRAGVDGSTLGSCLCAAVTFAVRGAPGRWLQCHCSRCRRGRSAAHGSNMFYPLAQFEWRAGREWLQSYRPPDAQRFALSFCKRCGGAAPAQRDNVPFVLVPAGLLDGDPGVGPEAHIHVASKAPWFTIHGDLPQWPELPPA